MKEIFDLVKQRHKEIHKEIASMKFLDKERELKILKSEVAEYKLLKSKIEKAIIKAFKKKEDYTTIDVTSSLLFKLYNYRIDGNYHLYNSFTEYVEWDELKIKKKNFLRKMYEDFKRNKIRIYPYYYESKETLEMPSMQWAYLKVSWELE